MTDPSDPVPLLLVDDDKRNLDTLEAILNAPGYRFVRAETADQALLALLHTDFAAIVLDIKMPGMSGLELAQLIKQRKRNQDVPILFLTAYYPDEKDALVGYSVGAVDYLSKPLNPEILRSKVSVFVDLYRKSRALAAANRELAETNQRLQAANEELESFCYTVSHDLRAPLRGMKGFSSIVLEDFASELPAEACEYLQRANRCAEKMSQLVDDLLSFSRLGRQQLNRQRVDTSELVGDVLEDLRIHREGREIEIAVGPLPECEGDLPMLRQVWFNLLSNALKFTRPHPIARIEIGCRHDPREGTVYFVRDDGAGFDLRYAEQLFKVFHRLHAESEFEGTGVGLSIVHRIVDKHGGRVWVESAEPDGGATFCFTVPAEPENDEGAGQPGW